MKARIFYSFLSVTGLLVMVGFILPTLFSAKSDVAVIGGWILSFLTVYFFGVCLYTFITWVKDWSKSTGNIFEENK